MLYKLLAASALFLGADALSGSVLDVRSNLGTDHILNVPFSSLSDSVRDILEGLDVDEFGNTQTGVDLRISADGVAALENAGVTFEDNTEDWIARLSFNLADPQFFNDGTTAAKEAGNVFYQSYQTIEAIHARVDSIAAGSSLATITSMGSSYEGRDLKVIEISKGDSNKPTVLYFCGVHAREWLPPMFCTHMAEELVKNGGHPLLDEVKFSIIPSVNPDGYVFSYQSDNMWRKTRRPNPGSSCVGTDINRNYDDHHCGQGASTNRCAQTYCGTRPFDQIETASLKAYSESIINNGGSILSAVDVHAYGNYWMSPWGWTRSLPPSRDYSRMEQCMRAARDGIRSVNGLTFTIGSSANAIYVASGGSDDWFYSGLGVIYSYTAEVRGNEFQPSASNIIPSNAEIFEGMVSTTECALAIENGNGGGGSNPTPFPTPEPASCEDMDPNGITYSNGRPAPCNEIGRYCRQYDFVRQRCPKTCGDCALATSEKVEDLAAVKIEADNEAAAESLDSGVLIGAAVGVGAVVGVIAALFIVKRQKNKKLSKTQSTEGDIHIDSKTFTKPEGVQAETLPVATKNPMMSMYDV